MVLECDHPPGLAFQPKGYSNYVVANRSPTGHDLIVGVFAEADLKRHNCHKCHGHRLLGEEVSFLIG